jgi:hypothetical protein
MESNIKIYLREADNFYPYGIKIASFTLRITKAELKEIVRQANRILK